MINKKELQFDDYTISFKENCSDVTFQKKNNTNPINFKYTNLRTGKLFLDLQLFNGYMFFDKEQNFYDIWQKKIYFNDGSIFTGDKDKEAFTLFDNFNLVEKNIKVGIDKIENEPEDEKKKNIENSIFKDLKTELENFDFNKIKLKNGKMTYLNGRRIHYIHENILEEIRNGIKIFEGEFIQEIKNKKIKLLFLGNAKSYNNEGTEVAEFEFFYGQLIGRSYTINPAYKRKKYFIFPKDFFRKDLEEIEKKKILLFIKGKMNV